MVFWAIWSTVFFLGNIIFMNFIIAEIGEIYETVDSSIENQIYKERCSMVKEVEDSLTAEEKSQNRDLFPRYIVIRKKERRNGYLR